MHARLRLVLIAISFLTVCSALSPNVTHAQPAPARVEADFKGAVGLGLVGAELGAVIPALVGVEATWAYIVFPAVGAAGGALGGFFALDKPDRVELSIGALTLGMALVIPALVVTLSATSYDAGDVETTARTNVQPSRAEHARARPARRAHAGTGMLRVNEGELAWRAPAVALVPSMRANGELRVSGLNVSLMSGQF